MLQKKIKDVMHCSFSGFFRYMLLVVLCKCLRQLAVRGSDQLESLSSFGQCAHFTFHDLFNLLLLFFSYFCNVL